MIKKLLIFTVILSLLLVTVSCSRQSTSEISFEKSYYVSRIIDGDTIRVFYNSDEVSVRFIGIDTPETHSGDKPLGELGEKAYWFTRNKINTENLNKSRVFLEFDSDTSGYYGRLLAYVYYKDKNGKLHFLNKEIMENGYARPLFYDDTSKHKEDFIEAYKSAFENRKGIFSFYDSKDREVLDTQLSKDDIGKIRWVIFNVKNVSSSGSFIKIESQDSSFYVTIRRNEYNAFFDNLNIYDLKDKKIKVYGEVWKDKYGKYEILARAEFEFVVIK